MLSPSASVEDACSAGVRVVTSLPPAGDTRAGTVGAALVKLAVTVQSPATAPVVYVVPTRFPLQPLTVPI